MNETGNKNKKYDNIAGGVFLLLLAAVFFIPGFEVPFGIFLAGSGLILAGIQLVRYFLEGTLPSAVGLLFGGILLASGISELVDSYLPLIVAFFLSGVFLLIRGMRGIRA